MTPFGVFFKFYLYEMSIKTEGRLMVTRDWAEKRMGNNVHGYRVSYGGGKSVLKL